MINRLDRMRAAKDWLPCKGILDCGETDDAGICMARACSWGEAVKSLSRAADDIEALRAERDALKKTCEGWAEAMSRATERHDAKVEALAAERDALKARVAELENDIGDMVSCAYTKGLNDNENWKRQFKELAAKHDARVTELLEANNQDVERRRNAEKGILDIAGYVFENTQLRKFRDNLMEYAPAGLMKWLLANKPALQDLVEGRAAVVPLPIMNSTMDGVAFTKYLSVKKIKGEGHRAHVSRAVYVAVTVMIDECRLDKPMENK